MPRKSYSTKRTGAKGYEFDIDGEVFKCHASLPAQVVIDLMTAGGDVEDFPDPGDPPGEKASASERAAYTKKALAAAKATKAQFSQLLETLEAALIPDSYRRFRVRMRKDVDLMMVYEIQRDILAYRSERPTKPRSPSSRSRTSTGKPSTAGRPRKALTR